MATIKRITRQSGPVYKAIVRKNGIPEFSKTFKTKAAAQHWSTRMEADMSLARAEANPATRRMTLGWLCDDYLENEWRGKDKTRPAYVAWWGKKLGRISLRDLTKQQVRAALRDFARGKACRGDGRDGEGNPKIAVTGRLRSSATVNRMRAALAGVLKYARTEHDYSGDPLAGIPREKEDNRRERFLSDTECTALLNACRAASWQRLYLLVSMALTTGARRGELEGLRYGDLDLPRHRAVLVDTKNGSSRHIHLTDEVIAEIQRFPSPLDRNTLLFASNKIATKPFKFDKHWQKALTASGIEIGEGKNRLVFHSLRHSAASYLLKHGCTLAEVGAVLGHLSQQSSHRYAHLADDRANALVRGIASKMLQGAS